MVGPARAPLDHVALAESLAALAYPLRLELLEALGAPVALSDIRVRPLRHDGAGEPARVAAKQTVAAHLDKLVEVGLVTRSVEPGGGPTYAVDPQRLYALTEELRSLSVRHSGRGRTRDATGTLVQAGAPRAVAGPRVVLVHGVYEGRAYSLDAKRPSIIGRRRDADVALDYDPFVSAEHARIEPTAQGMRIVDAPSNKNGTTLNWDAMERGGAAVLETGDVIGVGRSLLIYYGG